MEINRNVVDAYSTLTPGDISEFDSYTLVAFISAISKSWLDQEADIEYLRKLLRDLSEE